MSSEEMINASDCFLRELPSVKIGSVQKPLPTKSFAKEQLHMVHLSKKSQENIMETLKFIHGDDFTLTDANSYQDKGANLPARFWKGRSNLIVTNCINYADSNKDSDNESDRFKMFALLRLESYGFYKEHCQEALEYCNGQIEDALKLLFEKYMKVKPSDITVDCTDNELLEQRVDEKGVLESIYESSFQEKIKNEVWIISFKLDYIINLYYVNKAQAKSVSKHESSNSKKKKEKCKNFMRTQTCKYGNNCRFLHEEAAKPEPNAHLNNYTFNLEIRFPKGTKYPYEPPLIFLKTDAVLPHQINLHICKRLLQEAQLFANDGIASVYSLAELLRSGEEILSHIKTVPVDFILSSEKLFAKTIDREINKSKPTHYKKGATYKDKKQSISFNEMQREDKRLVDAFISKQTDSSYQKMQKTRGDLPAAGFRNRILNAIKVSQVIIVSGETGCGKSTQVPQFILDEWLHTYNNNHVEIVCTQPRRISAIGVAERVADERAERIGGIVGYQIRLESKISNSTRLTFCTTGILLRRLELDPNLSSVSHIIVDEVHERSEESDFLLLILKDLLPLRPDLKVILMSATLNSEIFENYFTSAPLVDIPGRTHPVAEIFLEDILEKSKYVFDSTSPFARGLKGKSIDLNLDSADVSRANAKPKSIVKDENLSFPETLARYNEYSLQTCKSLYLMDPDQVNIDLIETVLKWIVDGDHCFPQIGTILIFLPGISEITMLYDQLSCHPTFNPKYGKYLLIPLHSSLTSAEQAMVFVKVKEGVRKIVLSTNIAETSITIEDCIYVIDAGKMKEKHFDSNRNMESLETVWVTRANALQRRGRAGRVTSGVCIHLFTRHRYKYQMQAHPVPEIHRVPLEQILLNIKILQNFAGIDVHDVLNRLIEPPVKENIDSSILRLQNVGAFDKDTNLTALGHHLAAMPVDVRIGKLMLFGAIFSCVDSALTIAACLSYKNPFVSPFGQKENATAKKNKFSTEFSDQMTVLTAYNRFLEVSKKSYMGGVNFAKENYLSHKTLLTIADIKYQFLQILVSIDFVPINLLSRPKSGQDNIINLTGYEFNKNGSNARVISAILSAALYPNVAKVLTPEHSYVQSAFGAVPKEHVAKDFKFRTKQEQVFLHPSSVLFDVKQFSSPFIVYQEKVKTSKIYIRDCCVVPLIPLLLFSGFDVNISLHNGRTFLVLDDDNWIMFEVEEHKIAEMIKLMRLELVDLLEEKIKDPLLNILHHDKGKSIVSTILQLVSNE